MQPPTYQDMFQRNVGVFSIEEQDRLREMTVAIAGLGGLGGPIAYLLTRLGVGRLHLIDPEPFDASNLNRQFGAYVDSIGMNKAAAVSRELRRINPEVILRTWEQPLGDENIGAFLQDVDAVVDGIEFFNTDVEQLLHHESVVRNLWVFTGQGVGNVHSFTSFNPNGRTFESLFASDGQVDLPRLVQFMFPKLPDNATAADLGDVLERAAAGASIHFSSYSVLAPLEGALVTEDIISVLVRERESAHQAPSLMLFDLGDMSLTHYESGDRR